MLLSSIGKCFKYTYLLFKSTVMQTIRQKKGHDLHRAEISQLTLSSCSVRCTPNFFSPIVRSLTHMPPSPFTSRTWNSTFSLCSCSEPPHISHGCSDWPGSECQSAATGSLLTGLDGRADEESSTCPCPPPPPGSTPGCVSADLHWQNTSLSRGDINEPCWCILSVRYYRAADRLDTLLAKWVFAAQELTLVLITTSRVPPFQSESKSEKLPVNTQSRFSPGKRSRSPPETKRGLLVVTARDELA